MLVIGAIAFNLFELRSETSFTPMLNDGSMHAQMVRAASAALRRGQDPLTMWYPYLGIGSPQFMHYQSLGAILTGAIGVVVGPSRAFAWALYLLLALWPASIYLGGRLFGLNGPQAAAAAVISSLLFSNRDFLAQGYEMTAYLWTGYGLWSQLIGMVLLPIAWGASWRYIQSGRFRLLSIVVGALTIDAHFLTGYLVILASFAWTTVSSEDIGTRVRREVTYLLGVMLCSAWVVYPVIRFGNWASQNEPLRSSPISESFGAGRILGWFITGQLFDANRIPVLTVFVIIGIVYCVWTFRKTTSHRAVLAVFVISLLLFFGPPTFGPIDDLIPGSHDLFFSRFLMGVQLAGIFAFGIGAIATKDFVSRICRMQIELLKARIPRQAPAALLGLAVVGVLAPAWVQTARFDLTDARTITIQNTEAAAASSTIAPVIARLRELDPGRVYAGSLESKWGQFFTVGLVPMYKYLVNLDFDVVGDTLRTASLMTDPEANFDENEAGDYSVFGIRYLVLPLGRKPIPPATHVLTSGNYVLWQVRQSSGRYIQVASTKGTIAENRTDIGARTRQYLRSSLPNNGVYETVAFSGSGAAPDTLRPNQAVLKAPGYVVEERDALANGSVQATVEATTKAAVVLKVSFDPGWAVLVDGRRATVYMVSPALVAVTVGPGRHKVSFQYQGYGGYPWLFGIAAIAIAVLFAMRHVDYRRKDRQKAPMT